MAFQYSCAEKKKKKTELTNQNFIALKKKKKVCEVISLQLIKINGKKNFLMYLIKSKQVFKPKRKTKITVNKLSLKEISK